MKRPVCLLLCWGVSLLLTTATAFGETRYVGEIVTITVRTGKGTDHKIIEMIQTGEAVEVVEDGPDWTRIRLENGKVGWVLTRLLTDEPPSKVKLENLRREHEALLERVQDPAAEIDALTRENSRLENSLAESESGRLELSRSYEDLKKKSAAVSKLDSDYRKAVAQLEEMKKKNDRLGETLTQLQRRQIFRWFLSGAGVLLLGVVIGLSTRSKRRRSSLL